MSLAGQLVGARKCVIPMAYPYVRSLSCRLTTTSSSGSSRNSSSSSSSSGSNRSDREALTSIHTSSACEDLTISSHHHHQPRQRRVGVLSCLRSLLSSQRKRGNVMPDTEPLLRSPPYASASMGARGVANGLQQRVSLLEVLPDGHLRDVRMTKQELKAVSGAATRDLRPLMSPTRFLPQAVMPRKTAIVVCLEVVKAVILPSSVLLVKDSSSSSMRPLLRLLQKRLEDVRTASEERFEFAVLEALLAHTVLSYHQELSTLSAAVSVALSGVRDDSSSLSGDSLHSVLPLKVRLESVKFSVQEVRDAIVQLLASDKDLSDLYLSGYRTAGEVLVADRQEAETLLESIEKQLQETINEIVELLQRIHATESSINIALDNTRNRIIKLTLIFTMGTVCLSFAALPAALFGMNLKNGLEMHPHAFFYVSCAATTWAMIVFFSLLRICKKNRLL